MAREDAFLDADQHQPGLRVERPRAGDAIGFALRDAYAGERGLPDDMMAMLRRLDVPGPHAG
ncbi:hypothetical protein [Sphingomonas sp.]|uniref:hypothetical protein n=1 Tax=Sphingomonas sp. TaxID=28214 RepID=UPI0025D40D06|nr:hypothetical protein [Sphingomonas sp.]